LDEISGRETSSNRRTILEPEKLKKLHLDDYFKDLDQYHKGRRRSRPKNKNFNLAAPGIQSKKLSRKNSNRSIANK
jgi:hypothetical protein